MPFSVFFSVAPFYACSRRRARLYFHPATGAWRSLVAHLLWEQRVAGSNPVAPTTRVWFNGRTSAFQADDAGSIPVTRSMNEQQARTASCPGLLSIGDFQLGTCSFSQRERDRFAPCPQGLSPCRLVSAAHHEPVPYSLRKETRPQFPRRPYGLVCHMCTPRYALGSMPLRVAFSFGAAWFPERILCTASETGLVPSRDWSEHDVFREGHRRP